MAGDKMEVELAEEKLAAMNPSEQHYFKGYVGRVVSRSRRRGIRRAHAGTTY